MTNEIKIGEITFVPDTHCVDADTGLDVWYFSPGLVREMLSESDKQEGFSSKKFLRKDIEDLISDKWRLLLQRDELLAALENGMALIERNDWRTANNRSELRTIFSATIARAKGGAK